MIKNLAENEAVKVKDGYLVKLRQGTYRVNGLEFTFNSYITEGTIPEVEGLEVLVTPRRVLVEYALQDSIISAESMKEKLHKYRGRYWDNDDEVYYYPDLETELECKKVLSELDMYKPVYKQPDSYYEPVDINIIGCLQDTGSKFIETSLSLGEKSFSGSGIFRVLCGVIAKHEVMSLLKDVDVNRYELPTHTNIHYLKIDNSYIFTGYTEHWIKNLGSVRVVSTLEEATRLEKEIRDIVSRRVSVNLKPKAVDGLLLETVIKNFESVLSSVRGLEVKAKSSSDKSVLVSRLLDIKDNLMKHVDNP